MPDLRKDPIVGRWVIIAKSRARRPHGFDSSPQRQKGRFCPFCEGNEDKTPDEIIAYRKPGTHSNRKGWRVRVVPNKFPALEIEGELNKRGEGIYDMMRGVGAHEVIIESPEHLLSTSELSEDQLREVFWVYRDRLVDLKKDPRFVYVGPCIALKELVAQIELEKKDLQDRIMANLEHIILPSLEKIKLNKGDERYIEQHRRALENLTSSFGRKISDSWIKMTPLDSNSSLTKAQDP